MIQAPRSLGSPVGPEATTCLPHPAGILHPSATLRFGKALQRRSCRPERQLRRGRCEGRKPKGERRTGPAPASTIPSPLSSRFALRVPLRLSSRPSRSVSTTHSRAEAAGLRAPRSNRSLGADPVPGAEAGRGSPRLESAPRDRRGAGGGKRCPEPETEQGRSGVTSRPWPPPALGPPQVAPRCEEHAGVRHLAGHRPALHGGRRRAAVRRTGQR